MCYVVKLDFFEIMQNIRSFSIKYKNKPLKPIFILDKSYAAIGILGLGISFISCEPEDDILSW